jgi:acyl carrier protein
MPGPTTVSNEQVEKVVYDALESFGAEPSAISRDAEFKALDVDSLDLAEMSQIVNEEFGVKLTSDDVREIRTVGDAIDIVVARA